MAVLLYSGNAYSNCTSCTFTFSGSGSNYNLNGNQTLCIQSGTFTGNVNINGSNNVICIADGATFRPSNLNNANQLTIRNYGNFVINNAISFGGGTKIYNYKFVDQKADFNFNGSVELYNTFNSSWVITKNLVLQNNSSFYNAGDLLLMAELSTNSNTTLNNDGKIRVKGNFNPSGTVNNRGFIQSFGFININSNSIVRNYCTLYAYQGFNNNSNFTQNFGLVWVINNNALVQNNADYFQGSSGLTRGERYINNAAVKGSGKYHFSKETRNQGPFGNDGLGINFYSASQPANRIFDIQNTAPNASVQGMYFVPQDTTKIWSGCSEFFVAPIALDSFLITFTDQSVAVYVADITYDSISTVLNGSVDLNPDKETKSASREIEGKGVFTVNELGEIVFQPASGFSGDVSIDYTVQNAMGYRSNVGTITVLVEQGTILPVELLYFTAMAEENEVVLNWSTASEFNNSHFEIEKSTDGITFESILRTEGAGNSSTTIKYSTSDINPGSGIIYYRLKQVDFDGTIDFSKIVSVVLESQQVNAVRVFPNPAKTLANIQVEGDLAAISVYNNTGVLVKHIFPEQNVNTYLLSLDQMAKGLYIVRVEYQNAAVRIEKLIVQ